MYCRNGRNGKSKGCNWELQRAGVADAYIDFVPPLGYVGELSGWV
jgi:hypothetical protein